MAEKQRSDTMKKTKPVTVVVKQDENAPVAMDILAASIIAISHGIKKLLTGPFKEDALLLLIQHAAPTVKVGWKSTPLTKKEIKAVLDGISQLEATYLKKDAAR